MNSSIVVLAIAIATALSNSESDALRLAEGFKTQQMQKSAQGDSTPRAKAAGQVIRDCSDGCPEMVEIPSGQFLMGSRQYSREQPQHVVQLKDALAVARYDTTFDDWDACVNGGGCVHNKAPSDEGWGRSRRPVINVSWEDAKDYAAWLSQKTGQKYRLLTEAEWEYVARAGSTTTYPWGDKIDCAKAAYDGGQGSRCAAHVSRSSLRGTQPVGAFSPSRWGLFDMIGNVWSWCEDDWHPDYEYAPTDGSAWRMGDPSMRVLRGGAWNYAASALRSADRNWYPLNGRTSFIGFRVVRPADAKPPTAKTSDRGGSREHPLG